MKTHVVLFLNPKGGIRRNTPEWQCLATTEREELAANLFRRSVGCREQHTAVWLECNAGEPVRVRGSCMPCGNVFEFVVLADSVQAAKVAACVRNALELHGASEMEVHFAANG